MNSCSQKIIAHVRASDKAVQLLQDHLTEVSLVAGNFSRKIGLEQAGQIIGLLHDFGKYSQKFQSYIRTETGLLEPDEDNLPGQKGKIDHSTAGAQWIWGALSKYGANGEGALCAQILALCIASHHGGLIDNLALEGESLFRKRIEKPDEQTHLDECQHKADPIILERVCQLADKTLLRTMLTHLMALNCPASETITHFNRGMWTRFLFSCLIDADRISSADFESPENLCFRQRNKPNWVLAIGRLENYLQQLGQQAPSPIDPIRQAISEACLQRATEAQGIYTLTVPTGGGKTLASLRYALHHAQQHQLERIIYVIPYTSIIEQNAKKMREVLEVESDEYPWILEHHSNLEPETQTWHSKLATENWDAPIIVTTMVQFLETLFGGGTRGVRRLHQLANSVIIFDEIQTLPIRCTHLFCNALNFLSAFTKTTAVLCTATQPVLDKLPRSDKGQLLLADQPEIMPNVRELFTDLKRVNIVNKIKIGGWREDEIADFAMDEQKQKGSCLIIVNTKSWARKLYWLCAEKIGTDGLFHLSTNQCAAHRSEILNSIRRRLDAKLPALCISTQLIEAGVDIDFASVIRFLAGLDSIAQAAGRCNRNGHLPTANVYIVNPKEESINQLMEIKIGQEKTLQVLGGIGQDNLLAPEVMTRYFNYYFYDDDRVKVMDYPVSERVAARKDTLLSLLSDNGRNPHIKEPETKKWKQLRQSFMTASEAFKAIDAPTDSVIVQYGHGKCLVEELCSLSCKFNASKYSECLKQAQKYSVNVFPNTWKTLLEKNAIHEIHEGEGVYYLDERFYSPYFGLSTEVVRKAGANIL